MNQDLPPHFWKYRWSRTFFFGFLGVILVLAIVDRILAESEFVRVIDFSVIICYGLLWILLYWLRPDFFRR